MTDLLVTVGVGLAVIVAVLRVIWVFTRRSKVSDDLSESWRNEHVYDRRGDRRWK